MFGTRHAVVVTHSRLRESGTVVEEAVEQLTQAGFEGVDHRQYRGAGLRQAVAGGSRTNRNCVVVLGGDGTILRAAELVHAPACDSWRELGTCRFFGGI